MGAIERQRPALAHHAHVGQRLLDHHATGTAGDDEYQIEVAIAHFTDLPLCRVAAHTAGDRFHSPQPLAKGVHCQRLISLLVCHR